MRRMGDSFVVSGAGSIPRLDYTGAGMTRDEILARLDRHREAFASRDPARIAQDHAENGTFESQAAGLVVGRPEIQGVYAYWLKAFPDMEFTWREPVIDGDRAAIFWHFRGTLQGDFFGHAHPGGRVEFNGAAEYRFSPDGIATARHVFDFTGALIAAGVLKVKPQ
jgi:predicted ester cyclase